MEPFTEASPENIFFSRIESLYTIHHETRVPSLVNTSRFGRGVADCWISGSDGIGLLTTSLLERSSPTPIAEVSPEDSPEDSESGNWARRVSSLVDVRVKAPTTGSSFDSAASVLDSKQMSVDVVDVTIRRSSICG